MTRYFTRMDEIFHADVMGKSDIIGIQPDLINPENSGRSQIEASTGQGNTANTRPDTLRTETCEYMNIIRKSRDKVKRISTAFGKTYDDIKKLEPDDQLLSTLRENINELDNLFWGYSDRK